VKTTKTNFTTKKEKIIRPTSNKVPKGKIKETELKKSKAEFEAVSKDVGKEIGGINPIKKFIKVKKGLTINSKKEVIILM